jgi:3-deoxy-D-manno-octulosonic-acid transferase
MRLLYQLLLWLAAPRIAWHLFARSRREPGYRAHMGERFGRYDFSIAQPVLWIHAVSVGETRAAQPLIEALLARYPGHAVLLTHMTPTGRDTGVELAGERIYRCYLPYDYPFAVRRFLTHFRPVLGLLMETEVWPNLIAACRVRGIPLHLVNARLSEKSFRRYRLGGGFVRETLAALTGIAAQTDEDAARFRALGAIKVTVTGNIKFDMTPPPALVVQGRAWRAALAGRKLWLAASTREGEEALLLDAYAALQLPGVLLALVPRHPQRFDEVARLAEARGLRVQRRSAGTAEVPAADMQVWLGDSMGELSAWYAACDCAFVGGSLLPFGGQNLIEACAEGAPVVIGPHTFNFAEATRRAVEAGAAVQVADSAALARAVREILEDAGRAQAMASAGRAFAERHRGATARTLETLALPDLQQAR